MKKIIASFGLCLLVVTSSYSFAHKRGGMMGGEPGWGMHHLRFLDLTEEQRQQIKSFKEQILLPAKESFKNNKIDRAQLRELIRADEFNEAAVTEFITDMQQSSTAFRVAQVRFRHEVWQILTPEQQEKVDEMRDKRGKRGHLKN